MNNEFIDSHKYSLFSAGHVSLLAYGCYYFFQTMSSLKDEMNRLKFSRYHTPREIHQLASQGQLAFRPSRHNPSEKVCEKTIIEGVVDSQAPIMSFFSKKQLVHSEVRRIPIYSNNYLFMGTDGKGGLFKPCKGHLLLEHSTDFELYNLSDKQKQDSIHISRDFFKAAPELIEEIGAKTTKLFDLSFFENILVFFGLIFESVLFWYMPRNISEGVFIGYSDKEFGFRAGGMMSLLGDLVYNIDSKTFSLRNPKQVDSLIKSLNSKMFTTQLKFGVFMGIWAGITFWLYRKISQKKSFQKQFPPLSLKAQGSLVNIEQVMKSDEANVCIICCERQRSVLPKPCLHLSCCKSCFLQLKKKECPICREKITGFNEIFISKNLISKNSL